MKPDFSTYKPLMLSGAKVDEFKSKHEDTFFFVDAFSRQIQELFFIDHPERAGENKDEVYATPEFKAYAEAKADEYTHVCYPWNHHLVKTVGAEDYFRLKTNRNQDLITADEQKMLGAYRVAVLGMSVGSNIAFILTQAGISREITLADFDELDTTNLNRILGGAHQIGLNKTILAARRIYEDNPFAEVNILPEGVTEENLEALLKAKKIDCIVEEIDDIFLKIPVRQLAMKYSVPVLMVTDNGDGIVLHIERYDLGYKKIFHQDLDYWKQKMEALGGGEGGIDKKVAGGIIMNDIVGGPHLVDPKMIASVQKVFEKKLVSWSQLGSAAILGGVYVTVALKKIALGEDTREEVRAYAHPNF